MITYRQNTGKPRPAFSDIVEELLCFGWIDSKLVKLDETQTMLLCTPRRPRSGWAKTNKVRVERLTAAGLMQPKGLEAVARAKENGSWGLLNDVEEMVEPQDLRDALDATSGARRHWEAYPGSYRRQILHWMLGAKRPETRRTRVERVVSTSALNTRVQDSTQPSVSSSEAEH